MQLQDMEAAAARVSEIMKLLANKHRLLVLCQLVEGEKSVGELARLLSVREPAMSQQLAVLRREGLIRPRREAQTIYYELARDDIRRLMEFLYATYCGDAAGPGGQHDGSNLEADQRREREGVACSGRSRADRRA
jgi:DNA-binding transcriptional ArsR family regulator